MTGTIKRLNDKGFGFIQSGSQQSIFFHSTSLRGLEWDERLIELTVEFETERTEKGLAAINVRAA